MALETSFPVSYRIARSEQTHAVPENVIGPCAKAITKCMLEEKGKRNLTLFPYQTTQCRGN